MKRLATAVLGLALLVQPALAETFRFADSYQASGTNPNGSGYTARVTFKVVSDTTFIVNWKVGSTAFRGFGMRWDDMLSVSYEGNGFKGVVMYRILDNGVLDGRWTAAGTNGIGTETLSPD